MVCVCVGVYAVYAGVCAREGRGGRGEDPTGCHAGAVGRVGLEFDLDLAVAGDTAVLVGADRAVVGVGLHWHPAIAAE